MDSTSQIYKKFRYRQQIIKYWNINHKIYSK